GPSPASCADRSSPHISHACRTPKRPENNRPSPHRGHRQARAARSGETAEKSLIAARGSFGKAGATPLTPPINANKQKKPTHVEKMPIPSRRLKAKVMIGFEMTRPRPKETDNQEGRSDDNVEAVEAGRHEKSRRVDAAGEVKWCVAVLVGLDRGEAEARK